MYVYQIIVSHHFLDRIGQTESDSQGQTLGYGNDQYSHTDYNKSDIVVYVSEFPFFFFIIESANGELNTKYDDSD